LEDKRLGKVEERLEERKVEIREKALEKGPKTSAISCGKIDSVFSRHSLTLHLEEKSRLSSLLQRFGNILTSLGGIWWKRCPLRE